MEMKTIIHEEAIRNAKIETILNYTNRKCKNTDSLHKKTLVGHLQTYLEGLEELSDVVEVENELFDCESIDEIVNKIKALELSTEV